MTEPVRILLSGATGRMGQTLVRLIGERPGLELVGGIGHAHPELPAPSHPLAATPAEAAEWLGRAHVVVDFSSPELLRELLGAPPEALAGKALVVGTTGLGAEEQALLDRAAGEMAVLQAANFSVGVNLLLALAEQAARVLGEEYDVEIVEAHHRRKVDAPSGTALALGEAVARGRGVDLAQVRVDGRSGNTGARPPGQVGFHALRGGDVVGEHRVLWIGDRERVELGHVAQDRALFAEGALRAAQWLVGKAPGKYGMKDVLGL
jgi:4-hydroxy-tetrahydrodipicolinate reductase